MKGMVVPPPSYGPVVWNQDQDPITSEGSAEEKLHAHLIATMSGDVRHSYGLFLGLAADPETRPLVRDQLQFLGLIDLQDTIAGRKARNTGHKALRARAVVELADLIGWERAHGVYYIGVPDMAVGPLYYSLYDAACVVVTDELPEAGKNLKRDNVAPLTEGEVEEMVRLLMEADGQTVWNLLTAHLRNGKSIRSLGDAIQIGAAELILRTTVPRQFTDAQHAFDYCNAANSWMRSSDNPYQARVLYLMANFVNDAARSNKLFTSVIESECAGFDVAGRTPQALLAELDEAILAFDVPRSTALAQRLSEVRRRSPGLPGRGRGDGLQVPGRSAQSEDHAVRVRGIRSELEPPPRPAPAGRRAAPGRLAQDAGRARMLRPLHAGVDQQLSPLSSRDARDEASPPGWARGVRHRPRRARSTASRAPMP